MKEQADSTKYTLEKGLFAATLGALLPLLIPPLGAAPLMALRHMGGRKHFLLLGCCFAGILVALSAVGASGLWVPFATLFLLVGIYAEIENMGHDTILSGTLAVAATLGFLSVGLFTWLKITGVSLFVWANQMLSEALVNLKQVAPTLATDSDALLMYAPSAVVMMLIVALWFGLLFESRFRMWLGQNIVVRPALSVFKLPDFIVWITLLSLAGTFLFVEAKVIQVISSNVLNVVFLLYFLQGLSIVATYFRRSKTGLIWQVIWYFILLVQPLFFFFISLLGLVDYWVDFRSKLDNKSAQSVR